MSITYLGELTVGAMLPMPLAVGGALSASISLTLPNILAQIEGALSIQVQLGINPPNLAAMIQQVEALLASLALQLTTLPVVLNFQGTAVLALLAQLENELLALQVNLNLGILFAQLCATAGLYAYVYSGAANGVGAGMSVALAGGIGGGLPTDTCNALVIAVTDPVVWAAFSQVFKVA